MLKDEIIGKTLIKGKNSEPEVQASNLRGIRYCLTAPRPRRGLRLRAVERGRRQVPRRGHQEGDHAVQHHRQDARLGPGPDQRVLRECARAVQGDEGVWAEDYRQLG